MTDTATVVLFKNNVIAVIDSDNKKTNEIFMRLKHLGARLERINNTLLFDEDVYFEHWSIKTVPLVKE